VLDGVGVIRACLFEEPLDVVCGWSCLAFATTRSRCGMLHARAVCLLVDATIVINGGLLVVLLEPLHSSIGALLSTLDSDVSPSFYGAFRDVNRHMQGSRKCPSMCAASGHPCRYPPGITVGPPPSPKLIVA
jgi:hypothetical protein